MKIAMWSGPRNLSTAMMYSFASRRDFAVVDEPFYAMYLNRTGIIHPMRDEIIASQPTEAEVVIDALIGSNPGDKPHFYQKHMTQHMIDGVPLDWLSQVKNVFLLRHPARVIASYAAKRESPTLDDIGFTQQVRLFDHVRQLGQDPIVIDSHDIRAAPEPALRRLCVDLGLEWDPAMLSWAKGGHPDDGVWAQHWYGAVHGSTGFAEPEGPLPQLSGTLAEVCEAAMSAYDRMVAHKSI